MKKKLKTMFMLMFFISALIFAEVKEVGSSSSINLTLPQDMYLFGFSSDDLGTIDISGSTLNFSYSSHSITTNGYSYLGRVQFSVYWKVASRLNIRLVLDNVPEGLSDGNSTMKFIQKADEDTSRVILSPGTSTVATINRVDGVDYGVKKYSAFISMEGVKKSSSAFTAQLTLKVVVI